MREQFTKQLTHLRQDLIGIYTDIDLYLHKAIEALENQDKQAAREVKRATRAIDKRCEDLEDAAYQLIALQNPLASDLRLLQFFIYVDFNLQRMTSHVRNLARMAKQLSDKHVPPALLELLQHQADLVYMLLSVTVKTVAQNDLAEVAELPKLEKPVESLYKGFYKAFTQLKTAEEVDAASKVLMASRMLERVAGNALQIGERLVFLLTGNREPLSEFANMDEEELEDRYVGQNPSLQKGNKKIEKMTSQIPEVAHAQEVATRVREALELASKKNPFEKNGASSKGKGTAKPKHKA